jgi:hypothetical protein
MVKEQLKSKQKKAGNEQNQDRHGLPNKDKHKEKKRRAIMDDEQSQNTDYQMTRKHVEQWTTTREVCEINTKGT